MFRAKNQKGERGTVYSFNVGSVPKKEGTETKQTITQHGRTPSILHGEPWFDGNL